MRHKVILDVDTSTGMSVRDIDDGLVIALALASPEIELLGITTCGGNCQTKESTINTLRFLAAAARDDIPVAEGRSNPLIQDVRGSFEYLASRSQQFQHYWDGAPELPSPMSEPSTLKAHELIIKLVKQYPGEVTIVKEGSLTNLALALLVAPEIAPLIKEVIHMGSGDRPRPPADTPILTDTPATLWQYVLRMNTEFDPDATEIVIKSGVPFTFVTGSVTSRVMLDMNGINKIAKSATRYHQLLAETSQPWVAFCIAERHLRGARMHDPLALAILIDSTVCKYSSMHCNLNRFRSGNYPFLLSGKAEPQVRVAIDVDVDRFEKLLIERLSTPLPES